MVLESKSYSFMLSCKSCCWTRNWQANRSVQRQCWSDNNLRAYRLFRKIKWDSSLPWVEISNFTYTLRVEYRPREFLIQLHNFLPLLLDIISIDRKQHDKVWTFVSLRQVLTMSSKGNFFSVQLVQFCFVWWKKLCRPISQLQEFSCNARFLSSPSISDQ